MSAAATVVDLVTGEVVEPLDQAAARELTERIRRTADRLWELLSEAHERQAWRVLGYRTWKAYIENEFSMTERRSYQLLDQALVIRELETVAGLNRGSVPITERQAREIKPRLVEVTERIRERVAEEPPPAPAEPLEAGDRPSPAPASPAVAPERVREIVDEVVAEELERRRKRREDREATKAVRMGAPPGSRGRLRRSGAATPAGAAPTAMDRHDWEV